MNMNKKRNVKATRLSRLLSEARGLTEANAAGPRGLWNDYLAAYLAKSKQGRALLNKVGKVASKAYKLAFDLDGEEEKLLKEIEVLFQDVKKSGFIPYKTVGAVVASADELEDNRHQLAKRVLWFRQMLNSKEIDAV